MDAIDLFTNHRQILKNELDTFVLEYEGVQLELIGALARKIEHMCIYIGSPSSVKPMLKSIVNGKVKKWSDYDDKGKQLTGVHITEIQRKYNCKDVLTGHFRWDNKGWKADRYTRDYINYFYFDAPIPKERVNGIRFKIKKMDVVKHSENMYSLNIVTPKGSGYKYFYYVDKDLYTCNCGDAEVTEQEKKFILSSLKQNYKF